ncbi:MAG: sigma-54-dependent Fis family transcriptional regulator [Acidobacteria bacterium]|nr:sigma-54-dependent Fis family transcriptional regulator [Acidobacteriota bacterium]
MSHEDRTPICLLAIDDDPRTLPLVSAALGQDGLDLINTTDPLLALKLIAERRPQFVVLDPALGEMRGVDLLEKVVELDPGVDVVIVSSQPWSQCAVHAIQKGACDYFTKPLDIERFRARIRELVEEVKQRQRALAVDMELITAFQFQGIVGRSAAMLEVFSRIRRIAPHFRSLLITGATGTGKELVAKAVHQLSPAPKSRFVAYNCAAIVDTLIESELFGAVKGAFTGATQDKVGAFEYASGGVLFLDEIGDMPLGTQAKLLRVLQQQEIQRVGSPVSRKIDVRVIAATHCDLKKMVGHRQFREDLYYRLSMIQISIPPLAERKEDLPLLQRIFLQRYSRQYGKQIRGLTRRAQVALAKYCWPGNVRELENTLGHACMMAEGGVIDLRDLPPHLLHPSAANSEEEPMVSLKEAQFQHVKRVVEALGGNKIKAAQVLGISRATLYRYLELHGPYSHAVATQPVGAPATNDNSSQA